MNLVLLGLPGAGKGTQAKHLSGKFDLFHLSTGDLFRNAIENETELGKKAKSFMDAGDLVPDDLTISLIENKFQEVQDENGVIFDGFPRTVNQAKVLTELLDEYDEQIDLCIFIEVEIEELIIRLSGRRICEDCGAIFHLEFNPPEEDGICDKCGGNLYQRSDDSEDVVKNRIKKNKEKTDKLIEYYKEKGVLRKVVGTGEMPEDVKRKTEKIVPEYL